MKSKHILISIICLTAMLGGCTYPYEADDVKELNNILVVEGDVIANGVTTIKLSRSVKLSADSNDRVPEKNAVVMVEDSNGRIYLATETEKGTYEIASTADLDTSLEYRLVVQTSNGKDYASKYVPVCISPPIDSIGYEFNKDQVSIDIHVTTHDFSNKTQYFKWDYHEDWEYHSSYYRSYEFDLTTLKYIQIPAAEYPINYFCWKSQPSAGISVDNSIKLSENIIYMKKLLNIDKKSERTTVLYCIQVSQKGLTADGYDYWSNLQKNSESMGGIFAPQPNELRGNVYSLSDPKEVVLGYVGASTVTISDRLFIYPNVLLPNFEYAVCKFDTLHYGITLTEREYASMGWYPVELDKNMPYSSLAYWVHGTCADCRVRGGTKVKPEWWPNSHY